MKTISRVAVLSLIVLALPLIAGCADKEETAGGGGGGNAKMSQIPASTQPSSPAMMSGMGGANASQDYDASRHAASTSSAGPPRESTLLEARMGSAPAKLPGGYYARRSRGATGGRAAYNPNLYLSNTYMGGAGEKDRIEKLINEGILVDGKRVKLEAFTRTYGQTFPIPVKTALNLVADTERSKIIQSGDHTYLQVGLQAIKGEQPRRPPLNISLVLDRSGSMQEEDKLEQAKAAACQLVDRLGAGDYLSVIVFDDRAEMLSPAEPVKDRGRIKQRIAGISTGGGTNIYDGLSLGYQEVHKHAGAESVNLVILLSDGQVTAGTTDPDSFYRLASGSADKDIQTTTVGLGVEFNEDLMLSIAREGKGNYHFIKDGADTQKVFAKELDELTHVVAKAVKLRIKLADGIGFVRALGAAKLDENQTRTVKSDEKKIDKKVYDELGITANRQRDKDEPGIKLLIPNFYRGDSHVVMLEIAIPPGQGTKKVADVFLKYKDLAARSNRETQAAAAITYAADRGEMVASVNKSVKKNLLGFQTGEALKEAAALIEQGRSADAVRKIDERMVVLGLAAKTWSDKDLDHDGVLLNRYKSVLARLRENPTLASTQYGDYLRKSLTYNGYQMTR